MPPLMQEPKQKLVQPLFIGLQSYTEAQADNFYGRDDEIDRLTNLVKNNTLTIVFGKSGTGKTSLLNAGVFPRLRKDYCLPFRIRLEFQDDSPDLVTQIKKTLAAEIDKYGFKVQAYPSSETLWEYFHREQLWKSVTPILIFDQFEEIFTLGKNGRFAVKDLAAFWEELADLIENSIPEKLKEQFLNTKENFGFNYKVQKVKTLFSFREEFLPEFESITAKIPSIKYSRFRLMPMNGNQAYEVITKTWMEKIDATQAHKIVGFFANNPDKKQPYELMEIEPSLLSQVCSFIDKERMVQGGKAISAEFLNRYPKELILRSIYNEVLDESNAAVALGQVSRQSGKPVSEFVEDKLITDEGYRTKYVMTEQDAVIKPGIEILKSKYFVRDDGKSVELTHDVLAPLIKKDREIRRKRIAMEAARRKANRRSVMIVMVAIAAGLLFWFFMANKAIKDKNEAIKEKEMLEEQIKQSSASLDSLVKSIDSSKAKLKEIKNDNTQSLRVAGLTWNDSLYQVMMQKYQADSTQLDSLSSEHRGLAKAKTDLENVVSAKTKEIHNNIVYQRKLDSTNNASKQYIIMLRRRIASDSARLALLQRNYKDVIDQYDKYIVQVSMPEKVEADTTSDILYDTNSLHLNLRYPSAKKGQVKAPKNLRIYLLPDNNANKNIIRNAKIYETYCDELNLDRARGKKVARYKDGVYKFYDVPAGKYFVKICTYYGGYYSYIRKKSGNERVEWEASPPIR